MLGRDFNSPGMETCRGSIPPLRRICLKRAAAITKRTCHHSMDSPTGHPFQLSSFPVSISCGCNAARVAKGVALRSSEVKCACVRTPPTLQRNALNKLAKQPLCDSRALVRMYIKAPIATGRIHDHTLTKCMLCQLEYIGIFLLACAWRLLA